MSEDNRLHEVGDVVNGLEVTAVRYKEDEDHGRYGFEYTFRDHNEMNEEREAEAQLQEATEQAEKDLQERLEKARKEEEAEEKAHRNTEVDDQKEV